MANSGNVVVNTYASRTYTVRWSLTSQNATNNTSTISWALDIADPTYVHITEWRLSISIGGTTVVNSASKVWREYGNNVYTGSLTFTHDSSGNKSFTISVNASVYDSGLNYTRSGTFDLPQIKRASSFATIPTFTMGQSGTITISKENSAYYSAIKVSYGNSNYSTSGYINSSGVLSSKLNDGLFSGTSRAWTPPLDFANAIPTATVGVGSITLYTYSNSSGTTQIGSKSTTFYVNVPSTVVPSISTSNPAPTFTISNSNSTISDWGVAVQGYTKLNVTATAVGVYRSEITKFNLSGGYTISTAPSSTDESDVYNKKGILNLTTGVITTYGDQTFSLQAVDGRLRNSNTVTSSSIHIYPYSKPNIKSFNVSRSSNDITKVVPTFECEYSDVDSHNSLTVKLKWRQYGSDTWNTMSGSPSSGTEISSLTFVATQAFEFQLQLTDSLGNSTTSIAVRIGTQDVFMDFGAGGNKLGIGTIVSSVPTGYDGVVEIKNTWDLRVSGQSMNDFMDDCVMRGGEAYVGDINTPIYIQEGYALPCSMSGLANQYRTNLGNYQFWHTYAVPTSSQAASGWRNIYTSGQPLFGVSVSQLGGGLYLVNYVVSIQAATEGMATCRLCLYHSGTPDEIQSSTYRTRSTIPVGNDMISTFNVTFIWNAGSANEDFYVHPQVYSSVAFTPKAAFIGMTKIGDTWTHATM